jgi:hypothetical protein
MHPLVSAAVGGALIGAGASLLLLGNGRVAGISGIFFTSLLPDTRDRGWRLAFVIGMVGTSVVLAAARPGSVGVAPAPTWLLAVAGLAVGYGTRMGTGCTSGHGVCGLARFSLRSLVATCLFMVAGACGVGLVWAVGGPL